MDDRQKINILVELLYSYEKFKELLPGIRKDILSMELVAQHNSDIAKLLRTIEDELDDVEKEKQFTSSYDMSFFSIDDRKEYIKMMGLSHKHIDISIKYKGQPLKLMGGVFYVKYPSYYAYRKKASNYITEYEKKAYKELDSFKEKESILIELIEIIDNALMRLDSRESKLINDCFISIKRKPISEIAKTLGIKSRTTIYGIQKNAIQKLINSIDFNRIQKLYNMLFKKKVIFENYYDDISYENPYIEDVEEDDYSRDYIDKSFE